MEIGDIVEYIDDWKEGRQWYLYDIYNNLCTIVLLREGKYTHTKQGEEYINANIVNLNINKIKKLYGKIHFDNN